MSLTRGGGGSELGTMSLKITYSFFDGTPNFGSKVKDFEPINLFQKLYYFNF